MQAKTIIRNRNICGGSPTVEGTRLTCANVVYLLNDLGREKILQLYPYLTLEDITNALSYCQQRECEQEPRMDFCYGCILETSSSEGEEVWKIAKEIHL